ncbi:MAG: hypothetical protein ACSLE6_04530 [Mycobacterium sp.]
MDYFVSQLEIVLPVLGVNAIKVPEPKVNPAAEGLESPIFHLRNAKLVVDAGRGRVMKTNPFTSPRRRGRDVRRLGESRS